MDDRATEWLVVGFKVDHYRTFSARMTLMIGRYSCAATASPARSGAASVVPVVCDREMEVIVAEPHLGPTVWLESCLAYAS